MTDRVEDAALDAAVLEADADRRRWVGRRVLVVGEAVSTNDLAAAPDAVGSFADGLAVFAEHQSAGRGQYGRRWSAPPRSSLLFSLALRPTAELVDPRFLTAWSAVGVAETVDALYGLPARIKWPNAVLVDGRKSAGILVERPNLDSAEAVVVGVGLNVNIPSSSFPPDL
ncbi:MAG: biotin--[acetyl-CoA-carboxylase] ligase, partial [Planctomycetia bacterium]